MRAAPPHDFHLPHRLLAGNEDFAAAKLRDYLAEPGTSITGITYTGRRYDTWDGGGDRVEVRNVLTDADLTAITMLSVRVHPEAAIELRDRQSSLSNLLKEIPYPLALENATSDVLDERSAAWTLWHELCGVVHIKAVIASKLMARKRPALMPIWDTRINSAVGASGTYWEDLHHELQADGGALAHRLEAIRQSTEAAAHLSTIRVFDIVCWMA